MARESQANLSCQHIYIYIYMGLQSRERFLLSIDSFCHNSGLMKVYFSHFPLGKYNCKLTVIICFMELADYKKVIFFIIFKYQEISTFGKLHGIFFHIMIGHQFDEFRDDKPNDFIPYMHVLGLKEWNIACQHICCYISSKQRSWVSIIISQASNRRNNLSMLEKLEASCYQTETWAKRTRNSARKQLFYWSGRSSSFRN